MNSASERIEYGTVVRVTGCLTERHNGHTGEFREWCRRDNTYLVDFHGDSCWTTTMQSTSNAKSENNKGCRAK